MNKSRLVFAAIAVTAVLTLPAGVARAQVARSGGAASSQLQQQMQQLAAERTRMEAENTKLKKDLEDARKELESLKNAQKTLDARAKDSTAAVAASNTQ